MKLITYILVLLSVSVGTYAHEPQDTKLAICENKNLKMDFKVNRPANTSEVYITVRSEASSGFHNVLVMPVYYTLIEGGMSRELYFMSTNENKKGLSMIEGSVAYYGSYSPNKPVGSIRIWNAVKQDYDEFEKFTCVQLF